MVTVAHWIGSSPKLCDRCGQSRIPAILLTGTDRELICRECAEAMDIPGIFTALGKRRDLDRKDAEEIGYPDLPEDPGLIGTIFRQIRAGRIGIIVTNKVTVVEGLSTCAPIPPRYHTLGRVSYLDNGDGRIGVVTEVEGKQYQFPLSVPVFYKSQSHIYKAILEELSQRLVTQVRINLS